MNPYLNGLKMTLQEAIDKLNKIKETQSGDIRIVFPDLKPLRKIKVVNITREHKFVLISDK